VGLIERLTADRALKRICGFDMYHCVPHKSTFSRAFEEFANQGLANLIHEDLIKTHLGEELIGHNSRDATAIHAREKAVYVKKEDQPLVPKRPRGRPKKGEKRPPPEPTRIERQLTQTLAQMMSELPKQCDIGSKCNAQGFNETWKGYKFHVDTACCGVPVSAILTSASMHDSQAAIPLVLCHTIFDGKKLMDFFVWQGAKRSHSRSYGDDEQRSQTRGPQRGSRVGVACEPEAMESRRRASASVRARGRAPTRGSRAWGPGWGPGANEKR